MNEHKCVALLIACVSLFYVTTVKSVELKCSSKQDCELLQKALDSGIYSLYGKLNSDEMLQVPANQLISIEQKGTSYWVQSKQDNCSREVIYRCEIRVPCSFVITGVAKCVLY